MIKTNKRFRHLVFFRLKKEDNNRRKKEAEKRTDEKEATKPFELCIFTLYYVGNRLTDISILEK